MNLIVYGESNQEIQFVDNVYWRMQVCLPDLGSLDQRAEGELCRSTPNLALVLFS